MPPVSRGTATVRISISSSSCSGENEKGAVALSWCSLALVCAGRAPWKSGKRAVPGYFSNPSGDDAPAGRLYDGSWRFYATQGGQREPASHRAERLQKEGLFHTTRTSTVIGVGPGSSEIPSKGVRENFTESYWAGRKREAAAKPASDAADVAMVRALP